MKQYYGTYWGCDWGPLLVLKNILRPKRLLTRAWYWNVWQRSAHNSPLHYDGIQFWSARFVDEVDEINRRYPLSISQEIDGYQGVGYLPFDTLAKKIVFDPPIFAMVMSYVALWAKVREPLHHSIAFPSSDMKLTRCMDASKEPFNVGWHYDTPNLVQLVILLNDVTEKDSHMQYARGEHRRLRVNLTKWDYYYSDEYAEKHFDVVKCIGPKGTAFLFDTNAPHRFFMVKNSMRAMVKVGYTPGNAMLWDTLK